MRILCVIDSLGAGGAQRQLVNLALGFKENGHEVSFLVYHSIDFYYETLKVANIQINEIIEPNRLLRSLKIRNFIRNGSFDSVLSFLSIPSFLCEISSLPWHNWKLVVGERSSNPKILKSTKLKLLRLFHLFADHVVANSYSNIKIVRQVNPFLKSEKCHVVYNIVDFKKWRSTEKFQFCKQKFKLLIAASHRYLKNLDGLIEAVNALSSADKKALSVDWYGEDNFDNSMYDAKNKIEKFGLQDIFTFYKPTLLINNKVKEADAVGLFSYYEGLPNSICEAMAAGKPIIATKVSDIPLLIEEDVNGFLCEATDVPSIKHAITKAIHASRQHLEFIGEQNAERAYQLFNGQNITESYLRLLKG